MLYLLTVFAALLGETYLLYTSNAPANALNDKWRIYQRARRDQEFDTNYQFYMLSNS